VMRCVAVVLNISFLRQTLGMHVQAQLLFSFPCQLVIQLVL
jgi:hypothetical protein